MRAGFALIAVAFPVYLLWRGELPTYLALMTASGTTAATSTTQSVLSTLGSVGNMLNPPAAAGGAIGNWLGNLFSSGSAAQ